MSSIFRTTFLGASITVFLPDPNWKKAVQITPHFSAQIETGDTGRENRTPRQEAMRLELQALFTLPRAQADELNTEVGRVRSRYWAIPLYPDKLTPAEWSTRIFDAQYVINFDASGWEIFEAGSIPSEPTYQWLAPLLVGRLIERPKVQPRTDWLAEFTLKLLERSPWGFRITPAAETVGVNWPAVLQNNWREHPDDQTEDNIEYVNIGDGRPEIVQGGDDAPRRSQTMLISMWSRSEIRSLLNFALSRKFQVQSFLVPWNFRPGEDTTETPYTVRARFAADSFAIDFTTDQCANSKIRFLETPWETDPISGEEPEQDSAAYLYRFTLNVPGGPLYWRWTSWERDVIVVEDGLTVTYIGGVGIEHDKLIEADDMSDNAPSITTWVFPGNPIVAVLQRKRDIPLSLDIFKCNPVSPGTPELRFFGTVGKPKAKGRKLSVETFVFGGSLETKVPHFFKGPNCNYDFCGLGCGLNIASWTFGASCVSQVGNNLTVHVTSNPDSHTLGADFFSGGYIEFGSGEDYEIIHIVQSFDLGSGNQKFALKRPLRGYLSGASLTMVPYCSGTYAECRAYGNDIRFGGHPRIGPKNLSIPQNSATPGGVK